MRESSFADEVQYMIPINLEERGEDPQSTDTQANFFLPAALWLDTFEFIWKKSARKLKM